jgi:hypothetical protein
MCASLVSMLGRGLREPLAEWGGELPLISRWVFGVAESPWVMPVTMTLSIVVGVVLVLIGRDDSRARLHTIVSNLVWLVIVLVLVSCMYGFAFPFMHIIQSVG